MDPDRKKAILKELGDIPVEVYDGFVGELLGTTKEQIKELRGHLTKSDLAAIAEVAHSIKGAAANLRLEEITTAAMLLESSARDSKSPEEIEGAVKQIEDALASLGS